MMIICGKKLDTVILEMKKSYGSRTLYKYVNVNNTDNNLYSFCICLLGGEYSDTKDIGETPILSNTIVTRHL